MVKMVPKKKFLFDEITTDPVPFKQFDRVVKHTMHNRKKPCGHGVRLVGHYNIICVCLYLVKLNVQLLCGITIRLGSGDCGKMLKD